MEDLSFEGMFGSSSTASDSEGGTGRSWWRSLENPKPGQTTTFVCRVMPPMFSLRDLHKGWAKYHQKHFGWKGVGREGKFRNRPFGCVKQEDFRTKMVTVACPACTLCEQRRGELERLEKSYIEAKMAPEQIEEHLMPHREWLKEHNLDKKYYLNIMTPDNTFEVLQISPTCKSTLDATIENLRSRGFEPIDVGANKGVWLRFTVRRERGPLSYTVEPVRETKTVNGELVEVIKTAPLNKALAEKALEQCKDLRTVVQYLSVDQVNMLVASNGDPEEIDRIWQLGTSLGVEKQAAPKPKAAPTPTQTANVVSDSPSAPVDEEAELLAKIERIRKEKAEAARKTAPTQETTVAAAQTSNLTEMSDEEFFKTFSGNK